MNVMNNNHQFHLQQQYVFELNEYDVLCGRGSGPNDRVGNIEFRNLVLSRKAEYLAAPSRDAKGRIANSIVDTVRARGGRFLKKLSASQTKEAGFKRGTMVYELENEATVLEKAKQTLRQNRAVFVKERVAPTPGTTITSAGAAAPALVATVTLAPTPTPSNGTGSSNLPDLSQIENGASASIQNSFNSIQGSLNPIPMDASAGLDSMQRPNLSARTTEQLTRALFTTSSNMSSVTISSLTNPNINNNNSNLMSMGNPADLQLGLGASTGSSANYSIMSMNTAELCAAMGGGNNVNGSNNVSSQNNMSQNSNMTGNSTQAFGNLLKEYNTEEEKTLMQQFDQLKAQQQLILQQQQMLQSNTNNPAPQNNTNFQLNMQNYLQHIPEDQQQLQFNQEFQQQPLQDQGQQGGLSEQDSSDVFASLIRQYATEEQLTELTSVVQPQQYYEPSPSPAVAVGMLQQHQQQQQSLGEIQQQMHNDTIPKNIGTTTITEDPPSNDNDDLTMPLVRRLSVDDQTKLLQQFQQLQQQQQLGGSNVSQTQYNLTPSYMDSKASLNDLNNDSQQLPSFVDTKTSLNDSQPIQYDMGSYMDSNDSVATIPMNSLTQKYMDSSTILNDYQPTKIKPTGKNDNLVMNGSSTLGPSLEAANLKFDPTQHRASSNARRRSTLARDNRANSTLKSDTGSLRLSNIDPADYTEESIRLSFLTANRLANTLDDMSTTSLGASSTWGGGKLIESATNRASWKSTLDSSMISLMSMTLDEIAQDPERNQNLLKDNNNTGGDGAAAAATETNDNNSPNNKSRESSDERILRSLEAGAKPEFLVEKNHDSQDLRFGESVMSLGASLDEATWNEG